MRGIVIISALISAACGYKIEPEYKHGHPTQNPIYNEPPVHKHDYPSQPPVYEPDYPRQPPVHKQDYPSQPPVHHRPDYPRQPPVHKPAYPNHPTQKPVYMDQHPPQYGVHQFDNDAKLPYYDAVPLDFDGHDSYESSSAKPPHYNEVYEVEDAYDNYYNEGGHPEQQYWSYNENRVITPSQSISNGYVPREIMHFRETFKVLRHRYPSIPLFTAQDFMVNGKYPEFHEEEYPEGARKGKLFLPFMLPGFLAPLFGGKVIMGSLGGGGTTVQEVPFNTTLPATDDCSKVCGNNEGLCMDLATCVANGGHSIGSNCDSAGNHCCQFEYSHNAYTDSSISFFTSPGFPSPVRSSESFTLSVQIREDVDQLLIEFTSFEMASGPNGCSESEYFEIISSSYAGGVLGPDNSRFCGVNTDQHLYLDVVPGETVILKGVFAGITYNWDDVNPTYGNKENYYYRSGDSRFKLKIIQLTKLDCIPQPDPTPNCIFHALRAPRNCIQYYSEMRGTFMNFNYDGRTCMPPNLDYKVCFAHPENYCGISMNALEFDIPTTHVMCMDGANQAEDHHLCCTAEMTRTGSALKGHVQKYLGLDGYSDGSTKGISYVDNQLRYFFCGSNFGKTNFVVSEARGPMVAQVYSDATPCTLCEGYKDHGVGFKIRYNINAGNC